MNNINTTGYTNGTNTESNPYNIIPSNIITMQNVDKPLTLIPIIDGKPQYNMRKIANPGDPDIDFGDGVTGVIEIPYAQSNYSRIGNSPNPFSNMGTGINYDFLNGLNYTGDNIQTALDYSRGISGNSYVENSNPNFQNPYVSQTQTVNGIPPMVNFAAPTQADISQGQQTYLQGVDNRGRVAELSMNNLPTVSGDPNQRQRQEASDITNSQTKQSIGAPFVGAINPYGGWNMANASTMLGASIESGDTLGIIGSAGKILTEGARNAFSGAAAMRRYNTDKQAYLEQDAKARQRQDEYWATAYQEGGKVSNKRSGLLLTGNFLDGNDEHPMPNAEVERGEYLQTPDGNTMEVLGKKHSEGGELISVPENTKVISDYIKIGGKMATYLKKNYNLNVSAGSSYATVLDRYKKKIGLTELLDEEAKIMKKIVDQDDVKFESTRDMNLQVLSKRANDIQPKKEPLEQDFNDFTNFIYQKQEESKGSEGESFEKQQGGEIDQQQADIMNAVQQYAEANNQDPQELLNQIQSLPPDQQQQMLSQIVGASNPQNQGSNNIQQLIQTYAEAIGQDANLIIEQMQKMDDNQLQQFIQEMSNTVQGNKVQPQPDAVPDMDESQPEMKKGGKVKNEWISHKIKLLMNEGRPQNQAIAIANSMWEDRQYQNGREVTADPITKTMLSPDYTYGLQGLNSWVGSRVTDPNYDYTNLPEIANRFSYLRSQRGLSNEGINNMDIRELGELAGEMQQYDLQNTPGLAKDYSLNVGMTRNGLKTVVKDKAYMESLKKDDPTLYEKVQSSLKPDGTVKVGSYKNYTDTERAKLTDIVKSQPQTFQDKFIKNNYFDNEAYFRGIDKNTFYFTDEKEFNDFKKQNKDKNIDGFYKTDRQGVYVKPILLKDKQFKTEAERDKWLKDKKADSSYSKHYYDGEDIAYTPIVKGEETPNTQEQVAANDITPPNIRANNGIDLPMAVPDQSNLPPQYLATSMRQVGNVQANRVFVSPDQNLQELSKQANTASNVLVESNPYTAGAGLANLQAQQNNAINQAITQTTLANQQDERNVNNINEERIMQRDKTNVGLADKYERESIVGLDNYYNEWRNFIDNRNKQNVVNWNLQNQQNMFNAINPNYKIGAMGQVYQTDEPFLIYDNNGQPQMVDPRTKKVITQKTTTPDGRTTQTVQTTTGDNKKRQKGGLVISTNLLDLLK